MCSYFLLIYPKQLSEHIWELRYFHLTGADSLWLCCNKSSIVFSLSCARIRINNVQWIIKERSRQWAILGSRDDCVFQRDPSFHHPWNLTKARITTAKQQNSSSNQQNKVSFFHPRSLKVPPSSPFTISEAIKNCSLPIFDGVTPFDHCSSADDSLTFNIHSFHINSSA